MAEEDLQIFNKNQNTLFSLSFMLIVINFNFNRLGITYLTMGEIGFLLIALMFFINIRGLKITKSDLLFFSYFTVIIILFLFSTLLSANNNSLSLLQRYFEIYFIVLLTSFLLNQKFDLVYFIRIVIIGTFIINVFVIADIIINLGISSLSNLQSVRIYLRDSFQYNTINALMNKLLFMNCFSIGIVFSRQFLNKKVLYISIINLIIFTLLAILSGSRQTLVGTIVFLIILLVLSGSFNNKRVLRILLIMLVVCSILCITFFLLRIDALNWLGNRFGVNNIKSFRDIDARVIIAISALNIFSNGKRILFGYGLNSFPQILGVDAHNGYLRILFETGILGLSIFVFLVLYYIIKFYMNLCVLKRNSNGIAFFIGSLFLSIFITFTFVMNLFNEIFEYHFYWMFAVILVKYFNDEFSSLSNIK